MLQTTKSRKTFFYTFLVVQLLLNVTFTNAAVIRREKREIAANVTGVTTTNNELDSATVTTEEDVGITLAETGGGSITTGNSLKDVTTTDVGVGTKEGTTLTGSIVDENTVSFTLDDEDIEDEDKNEEEDTSKDENTTIESLSQGIKPVTVDETALQSDDQKRSDSTLTTERASALREETSSKDEDMQQTTVEGVSESGYILKEETSTVDVAATQPAVKTEETTSQVTVDSVTGVKQDDSTTLKTTVEGTTMSTVKPDEATNLSTVKESEPVEVSTRQFGDDISTTFVTGEHNVGLTDEISPISSTPLSDSESILTDDVTSLSSTIKSDETSTILTSTETSDDNPIQTTFIASPLLQDPTVDHERKNASTTSAEKRGKFIDDNYSSPNELRLPNTSDVWALAGMKTAGKVKLSELQNSVETSDEKALNNSMVTKSLFDWTRVMLSTHAMDTETTVKAEKVAESTTTDASTINPTTEVRMPQENEVDILSTKSPTEATTEVVNLTDKTAIPDSTPLNQNYVDSKTPPKIETTTSLGDNDGETTPERFTMDDSSLPQTDDILSTTKSSLNLLKGRDDAFIEDNKVEGDSIEEAQPSPTITTTTTTTTTPIPNIVTDIVTMKSETSVNGETIEEQNTGTISTSTLSLDFTTLMPFLTSTTTTTTQMATPTTQQIVFNMDDRTNEPPNMESTLTPSQSSPAAAIVESTTITTTTTTTPAVTVMAATTETQTTEAHTPAIISTTDDTMTQKNNNYNNYEVVNKTNTKLTDNSSIEAFEVSTRVSPNRSSSTVETTTTATEVDSLDDFDVTVSNLNSNNAFEIATAQTSTTTVASTLTVASVTLPTTTTTSTTSSTSTATEDLDNIGSIHKISDTAETAIESNVIDPLHAGEASTTTTTTVTTTITPTPTTTTEISQENMRMQSTGRVGVDSSSTTTARYDDDSTTTLQSISTKKEDVYSIVPTIDSGFHVPKLVVDDTTTTSSVAGILSAGAGQPMDQPDGQETDVNVIIAISVSVVGIVALIMLVAFLYVMRKRQKQMSYGQRCRPVSLDAYSLDNVSVYNSVRRKGAALRASKRSYGNVAFDDPSLRHNVLGTHELAKYVEKKSSIWEEFKDVPQIIARADEVPAGCEDKNRYANVIPLPETRVILQQQNGDEKSEYINANYVRGPKDTTNYYIACQAPLETTVTDFWRMIWEQNSRVIIMATDLIENGIDKCAEYLPPSVTLDNHTVFGDFQVTLKNREVKEKYAISTLMLRNTVTEESREITHYWYQWPEAGVPTDEAAIIAMLLEARSSLKLYTIEQSDIKSDTIITDEKPTTKSEINGNAASEKPKLPPKDQGPLTIHCSPGTGRTGTILACDIAMRCLEEPKRCVDIPQIVYSVRRGRASAVQTKEQYEFIYKVTHMYATKISNLNNDN